MLVRNKALSATYLRVCLTFLLNYCILYGLTQWLQQTRGLSAVGVGLLIVVSRDLGYAKSSKVSCCGMSASGSGGWSKTIR